MYSPKIREDLIPKLYHLAKERGIPMTSLVNNMLDRALKEDATTLKSEVKDADISTVSEHL